MSDVNIKPLADRVVILPAEAETKTASGNHYPRHCQGKTPTWHRGGHRQRQKDEPMTVKVGDAVLYGKYAGTELHLDGKDYLIMRRSDIVAII